MTTSREELKGMTTNERLFVTGMMNAFDEAVRERDSGKVRSILRSIFVDEASIENIVSNI